MNASLPFAETFISVNFASSPQRVFVSSLTSGLKPCALSEVMTSPISADLSSTLFSVS
jgi:hypothetical protein